jgi:pSer/pThr/pTyr-binding forkhead associated (FHA) protein
MKVLSPGNGEKEQTSMHIGSVASTITTRLALEYAGRTHPVHKMPFVLGRARECELVLAGNAVSRRHAALVEHAGRTYVEDLGSTNGVLVNAWRVQGRSLLRPGDALVLGTATLCVSTDRNAVTLRPTESVPTPSRRGLESTVPLESLDLFASAVDQALLAGRVADAERLFAFHLGRPLEQQTALARRPAPDAVETIALVALRLAEASRNDAWIDFTIRVYASRSEPMPITVASGLCSIVSKVRGVDVKLLGSYVAALTARAPKLSAEERHIVERLRGLETVARRSRNSLQKLDVRTEP